MIVSKLVIDIVVPLAGLRIVNAEGGFVADDEETVIDPIIPWAA
jgi:hypothetical protein